eukprot:TRINITY_DN3582_c0_g1_i3.p1 TRINITY_DN3582_c0_g1~~TRINITY_DN3582_c0_g1_i3.p1  ORF type:complete len:376 (+),score=76.39 TRINITY_DN3582_c0_g1_i3:135-1130(+)
MATTSETICNVWASNLQEEMARISSLLDKYPYVAFDTEFPGFPNNSPSESVYKRLKGNVDMQKIIQLGLTLTNSQGELPPGNRIWQFNFRFDLLKDNSVSSSIDLLKAAGLNFESHKSIGVKDDLFGELMFSHGLVLNDSLTWISFQGNYDFAYFLQLATCEKLPDSVTDFQSKLKVYFPHYYDIKCLLKDSTITSGGLSKIASSFGIKRVGIQHQAGSDSVVTAKLFFKLKQQLFQDHIDAKYHNVLYGLDEEMDYDPFSESLDDDYFYATDPSTGLESSPQHTSGLYYNSAYYRTTSPYSMGSYYIAPGFSQPGGQGLYGMYQSEGHMQ